MVFNSRTTAQESEFELLPQPEPLQSDAGAGVPLFRLSSLVRDGWPIHIRKLRSKAREDKLSTALSLVIAGFPGAFLVLAVLVIRLNGKELSNYGDKIIQATRLGPTVFPIVFAAIVGSLMRSWALWKAQNGAALGLLEQMNGSTSFACTIELAIALRPHSLLVIPILLLWAMSPLGGQGALRMISEASASVLGNVSVAYMNTSIDDGSHPLVSSSLTNDALAPLSAIYTTSILSSQEAKTAPSDVWGWPKIPFLPASSIDNDSWRVPSNDTQTSYTSLVGHVLQGVPPDNSTDFPIESSYFDFDCRLMATNLSNTEAYTAMGGASLLHHNASNLFNDTVDGRVAYSNFFIDTNYNVKVRPRPQSSFSIFYGSRDKAGADSDGPPTVTLFNCTMLYIRLEARVACENASCAVTRLRRSENATKLTPFNDADDPEMNTNTTLNNLFRRFPHAVPMVDQCQPSPTDSYIYGESSFFDAFYLHDWSTVRPDEMSRRFATTFNTFWLASLAPLTIPVTSLLDKVNLTATSYHPLAGPEFVMAQGTTSRNIAVYQVHLPWLVVFITATALLQLSALAGLLLRSVTIAPDILGYVSSLTRDNPHVPLPVGGSTLSGEDRARLLRDVRVQLADVEVNRTFGRVALVARVAGTSRAGTAYKRLRRRRGYE
ncbi:uncharacterized protein DSM5745_09636 [Aspergillus mulundensis]|uniref:Uncharacterized protein n=1 Tax=Aspergillus mulundensis TaxID=1810919 RepID=A0A3D8QVU2_9EURO|nr:hypothetical protein DSM5745_09636 [Aspergillus mulundensis]RDW65897.1 hypothetical protein DSM5745_09636 [Aspergillus mulundensis]